MRWFHALLPREDSFFDWFVEHAQIEEHLLSCPRCRADLDALREVSTALGNSVEPLPEDLWDRIASRLRARPDEVPPALPKVPAGKNAYKKAPQQEAAAAAFRSRAPLDAWTKLAHALFQTNEAIVVT